MSMSLTVSENEVSLLTEAIEALLPVKQQAMQTLNACMAASDSQPRFLPRDFGIPQLIRLRDRLLELQDA